MLNPQQMAAVTYIDGPLLVLAGAGSGKTRVITQKIAYLINECGYKAHSIVALTFTNKAANEMRARIATTMTSSLRRGLKVSTFHTLGLTILKGALADSGLRAGFSIFDSEDCQHLLRTFLPSARSREQDYLLQIQQTISGWKNELFTVKTVENLLPKNEIEKEAQAIYGPYQRRLHAYNAVDFDDLIYRPVMLLRENQDVRERWQQKIRHLLIDEYQDSNTSQYVLVKLLTDSRQQFTVVGDDDQSIYAWRGARPENLAQLSIDYPKLRMIKLEQNYRSTVQILHIANTLIAHNAHLFEKKLWSQLGHGEPLRILCCKDEQDEAEQVVADLISHKIRTGKHYADYAILYRGNHQARPFEKILRQHAVNYRLSGGQSWFSRSEIKDIFAYLKVLCNPLDDAAFIRAINTPKRGIGEATLTALAEYAKSREQSLYQCADHLALKDKMLESAREALFNFKQWLEGFHHAISCRPLPEILRELVDESGYEAYVYEQTDTPLKAQKRMENVWELMDWVVRLFDKDPSQALNDVINRLILIDILEKSDNDDQHSVHLMTLHASKGLEFPYVYLVGMEEELLPHRVSIDNDQIEEERRLAYVGITRAGKSLCMSLAKKRRRGGELQACLPSRFLEELPADCIEWYGREGDRNEAQSKAMAASHLTALRHLLVAEKGS